MNNITSEYVNERQVEVELLASLNLVFNNFCYSWRDICVRDCVWRQNVISDTQPTERSLEKLCGLGIDMEGEGYIFLLK